MKKIAYSFLILCGLLVSCKKDNVTPPLSTSFSTSNVLMRESAGAMSIKIVFPSPVSNPGNLTIQVVDSSALYGQDYVTVPDGSSKAFTIPVAKGATELSFVVMPKYNLSVDGDRFLNFKIASNAQFIGGTVSSTKIRIVQDDMVCFLPMNGKIADVSYYGNFATGANGTWTQGHTGSPNTGYQLDGISNYFAVNNTPVLDTISKVSISAWFKPTSFYGGNFAIIEKPYFSHVNPYYQYKLGITGDQYPYAAGTFTFSLSINGQYVILISPNNIWTPGNWYFVVGTYDGNNMNLYVNGLLAATQASPGVLGHYGQNVYGGLVANKGFYTPGTFGPVRIFNRVLSLSEIEALYIR